MFDIGWSEMAIIALVALVVLGPKELPQAMRTFANFSKKMRRYAQEFRAGVDNIVREADLEDARKALEAARSANPKNAVKKLIDPTGEMTDEISSVEAAAKDRGDAKPAPIGPVPQLAGSDAAPAQEVAEATPAEGAAAEPVEAPPASIVTEPLKIAPGNSIRPPVEIAKVPSPAPSRPAPAAPVPTAPPPAAAQPTPQDDDRPA